MVPSLPEKNEHSIRSAMAKAKVHRLVSRVIHLKGQIGWYLIALYIPTTVFSQGSGLMGTYFTTTNFTGGSTTRLDRVIDFDWGAGSPNVGGVGPDHFSVRWTGQIEPRYSELYTFYVTADDGATLWVNDRIVVSRLFPSSHSEMSGTIQLKAGQRVNICLEFVERSGNARIRLEWSSARQPREIVPTSQLYPVMRRAERGGILYEHWANLTGSQISALTNSARYPNSPDGREIYLRTESLQTNWAKNIGGRLRGYLVPLTNGTYTFALSASDSAALWLSTNDSPSAKRLLASVPSATRFREWGRFASQISTGIHLIAWQKYYFEVLHKAGTNENHFSVAWRPPGASEFVVIGADHLVPDGLYEALPPSTNLLRTLANSHPRLFATAERFAWLRTEISSNTNGQPAQWYRSLYANATSLLARPPVQYTKDERGTILDQSRAVVDRMYTLGIVWKVTGLTNFAERAWAELYAAGNFPDWNPAHFLDTAEMTHGFALGYDWFYEYWSPARRTFLLTNIVVKGLQVALQAYSNNVGWSRSSANNWNFVCNGGLTIGALAVGGDAKTTVEQLLGRAIPSTASVMPRWTTDFGAWYEGPGYWGYASDYNFRMMAALQSALGTDFGLSAFEGLQNAGLFAILQSSANRRGFNFADAGSPGSTIGGPQMFWWCRRFNVPVYAYHERSRNRAGALGTLWWDSRGMDPLNEGIPTSLLFLGPRTTPFQPQHVVILRSSWGDSEETFLACKGGEMGASHGHLDAGSFVLEALGSRWAWDLGSDSYALPGYFNDNLNTSPNRWQYYRHRAEGHNTLVINPSGNPDMQLRSVAPVVLFSAREGRHAKVIVDLTPALPKASRVWRGFRLIGRDRKQVLIQDEIIGATNATVWWFMHFQKDLTEANISSNADCVTLVQGTNRLWCKILGGTGTFQIMDARPLPTSPDPAGQNPNNSYGKLAIRHVGVTNLTIRVWFVPLKPNENPPISPPPVVSLQEWSEEDDPPIARDVYLTTPQNTAVSINLRALVSDFETPTSNLVLGVMSPSNGTVSLLSDQNTARFLPMTNFHGTGFFLYTVRDGANHVATGGVVVTILPSRWYWDGSPTGGLQAVSGTWSDTHAMWATSAAGAGPLQPWPRSGNDAAFVGAGGSYTVQVLGTQRVANIMTSNGTWTLTGGTLQRTEGSMTISAHATSTVIRSGIIGNGDLIKDGLGTLVLAATNRYPGLTIVNSGTLVIMVDHALPSTTGLIIGTPSGTVASLIMSNCNQLISSLRFTSPNRGTNAVWIAPGNVLAISNRTPEVAFEVGGFGPIIGSRVSTTHVVFAGGGGLSVDAPLGKFAFEPSGTNGGIGLLDLSGLRSLTVRVAQVGIGTIGGWPHNVPVSILLRLATNNWIVASNVVVGASAYATGRCDLHLGVSNTIFADNIVFHGGRYSGVVTGRNDVGGHMVVRGVSGGQSRANLFLGDQVGASGLTIGGGSSTCEGTLDVRGYTVDMRLKRLVLGAGAAIGSSRHGVGRGQFFFGGASSTVDVEDVYLGYTESNSSPTTDRYVPTNRGVLVMQGGVLGVHSNLFVGYNGDNDAGQTQRVAGVMVLDGGTATVWRGVVLGWATNRVGGAWGELHLSNGVLNVYGNVVTVGATGTIYLAGGGLNMNGNSIGSASQPIGLVVQKGTLQEVGEVNGGRALVKTGVGTLALVGTNRYTGPTLVSNGVLRLSGQVSSSSVTIASNATLAGSGLIGKNLTLSPGAVMQFMVGTNSDRIDVRGNLSLAGRLDVYDGGGLTNRTYVLFTYTSNLTYRPLTIGSVPTMDYVYQVSTSTPGQVQLVVTFRDSVGDGIPDMWRRQYFGGDGRMTNALSAAGVDPDGDGHTNIQEYRAGTDPRNSNSVLKVYLELQGSQLRWPAVPGRTYQVEYRDDLRRGSWQALPGGQVSIPAEGTNDVVLSLPAGNVKSNRFYRIRLLAP